MTKTLEVGDEMFLANGGAKLVYVGDNSAKVGRFIPERSATGGLTNSGKGKWEVSEKIQALNDAQIAAWLAKKG
jgi:hypothetical protein